MLIKRSIEDFGNYFCDFLNGLLGMNTCADFSRLAVKFVAWCSACQKCVIIHLVNVLFYNKENIVKRQK